MTDRYTFHDDHGNPIKTAMAEAWWKSLTAYEKQGMMFSNYHDYPRRDRP